MGDEMKEFIGYYGKDSSNIEGLKSAKVGIDEQSKKQELVQKEQGGISKCW